MSFFFAKYFMHDEPSSQSYCFERTVRSKLGVGFWVFDGREFGDGERRVFILALQY